MTKRRQLVRVNWGDALLAEEVGWVPVGYSGTHGVLMEREDAPDQRGRGAAIGPGREVTPKAGRSAAAPGEGPLTR